MLLVAVSVLSSCSPVKMSMAVPDKFREHADKMPVDGIGNGTGRKEVSFGKYKTSRIKRGWNMDAPRSDRNTGLTVEERVLKAFNIDRKSVTSTQKDKFQFTIVDGRHIAEVFAMERKVSEETRVKTNNRWLGEFNDPKNFQYSFSAVILPQSVSEPESWNLFLYSNYEKKPSGKIFEMPDIEEGGMLASQKDTIVIKTIKVQRLVSDKGKDVNMPFQIPSAYEFRIDDGVAAIIDTWGKVIWMYNELDEQTRLVIAAAASAILLRRIQNTM